MILDISGGLPLNFKITSYGTKEALLVTSPAENTIGIITESKITSWIFSASEPGSPISGMLWITIGANSNVKFNALNKNGIQICPISAKQYNSNKWHSMDAYIRKSGQWVQFSNTYLIIYENGRCGVPLVTFATESHGYTANITELVNRGSVEFGTSIITMNTPGSSSSGSSCQFIGTQEPVDVSQYNKLIVEFDNLFVANRNNNNYFVVAVTPQKSYPGTVTGSAVQTLHSSDGGRTVEIDVSTMAGNVYVVLTGVQYYSDNSVTAVISKIYAQ